VSVTQTVGATGGTVGAGGVVLTIPAGALAGDTAITVTKGKVQVPSGYASLSPVFSFEPAGAVLSTPATVTIDLATPHAGATIFWSNAGGGFDPLTTSITTTGVSASITRLGDGFAGEVQANEAGASSDSGGGDDGAIAEDAATDAAPSGDAAGGTVSDGSVPDGASADAAPTDGAIADANLDAASPAPDASVAPGITVTVDGVPTSFTYNVKVSLLQAWWQISADDGPSPTHWTLQLTVPTSAATLSCGGAFPAINYNHIAGVSADAGVVDYKFTGQTSVGGSCSITGTTSGMTSGSPIHGTFSGTLGQSTDAGGPTSHTMTAGSYAVVAP
jgi:hypothetical protein